MLSLVRLRKPSINIKVTMSDLFGSSPKSIARSTDFFDKLFSRHGQEAVVDGQEERADLAGFLADLPDIIRKQQVSNDIRKDFVMDHFE